MDLGPAVAAATREGAVSAARRHAASMAAGTVAVVAAGAAPAAVAVAAGAAVELVGIAALTGMVELEWKQVSAPAKVGMTAPIAANLGKGNPIQAPAKAEVAAVVQTAG